jgi:hypothetical protein
MNWQKQPNRNEHWLVGNIGGAIAMMACMNVFGGDDGTVKLWARDAEQLLKLSCDWARDYFRTSPDVSDADRAICGIPPKAIKIEK